MKTVQQIGLTALVLLVAILFAATPAKAGKSIFTAKASVSYRLTPPATDPPEPGASGKCTLQWVGVGSPVEMSVTCRGLTPGNQYCVVVHNWWIEYLHGGVDYVVHSEFFEHTFPADAKGRLNAEFTTVQIGHLQGFWVENDSGEVVLVEER